MKSYVMFFLLPILFCFGIGKKVNIIEPHELYESLTTTEKEFLETKTYFAKKSEHKKFSDLYKFLKNRSLPIYVTTDCVLHTYHILYDYSLRIL